VIFGLEYPPLNNLVKWAPYFGEDTFYEFNKIGLISLLALAIPTSIFLFAKKEIVPRGLQNVAELAVEFVEEQIIMPAIGKEGLRYLPLLLSMFLFIFVGNLFEVIPTFHMPANARMANPVILALVSLVTFVGVGVKHHGVSYFAELAWPPYVPVALRPLVGLIELLSTFVLRPFGLAVRLFANMLAGHILLVTFGVLCITLWQLSPLVVILPFSFAALAGLTAFEIFVSFLQAFVFSLLTAVYIDTSLHPAH
jgi:F-type H+-transporting ATPase subunit a